MTNRKGGGEYDQEERETTFGEHPKTRDQAAKAPQLGTCTTAPREGCQRWVRRRNCGPAKQVCRKLGSPAGGAVCAFGQTGRITGNLLETRNRRHQRTWLWKAKLAF